MAFSSADWSYINGRLGRPGDPIGGYFKERDYLRDARPLQNAPGWFVYPEPLPPLTGRSYRNRPRAERAGLLRAAELYLTDRNIIARILHPGRGPEFLIAPFDQWRDVKAEKVHDLWRLWVVYDTPGDRFGAFLAFDFLRDEEARKFLKAMDKAYASENRAIPPGWHPDPTGRNDLRWWDGDRWTSAVAMHNGSPTVDPQG